MRVMTPEEMEKVIGRCNWATICTVDKDGMPYAVEATPFRMDGYHCFMINPRGGTWKNLRHNDNVLLKYTLADATLQEARRQAQEKFSSPEWTAQVP